MFLLRSILVDPTTGEYMDHVPSTTELTDEEFSEYKYAVIEWAIEFFDRGPDERPFKFPERDEYKEFTLA